MPLKLPLFRSRAVPASAAPSAPLTRAQRNLLSLLATQIKKLRQQHHLTQIQLAKLAKTTQAAISRLENRQHFPSLELLTRIAEVLDHKVEIRFQPESVTDQKKQTVSQQLRQLIQSQIA